MRFFDYMRYNAELSTAGLAALDGPHIAPEHVQQLDFVDHIAELRPVGQAIVTQKLKPDHFAGSCQAEAGRYSFTSLPCVGLPLAAAIARQ
jgi:hypothetical protein